HSRPSRRVLYWTSAAYWHRNDGTDAYGRGSFSALRPSTAPALFGIDRQRRLVVGDGFVTVAETTFMRAAAPGQRRARAWDGFQRLVEIVDCAPVLLEVQQRIAVTEIRMGSVSRERE